MENIQNNKGVIKISNDVIARIATITCREIEGVYDISSGFVSGLAKVFGKKLDPKGVQVEINEGETIINISVIINFGFQIPQVASEIQEKVKANVEKMTGLTVSAINVNIDGANKQEPNKDKNKEDQAAEAKIPSYK